MGNQARIEHRKLIEEMIKVEAGSDHTAPERPAVASSTEKKQDEEYRQLLQRFINTDNAADKLTPHRR